MTTPRPFALLVLHALVVLWGCSCGASSASGPGTTELAPVAYSVHEWGVVRGGPGDTLIAHVIPPPPALAMPLVVLKPVLYFHLVDPTRGAATLTRSRVSAVEGEIREHFPLTDRAASEPFAPVIEWGGLRIEPGACASAFVPPTLDALPCSALSAGEPCEAASLTAVVTSDADCVVRATSSTPFLFYRSSTRGLTVPLRVARLPNGDLEIQNDGDLAIPGRIVRIQRSGGELRVLTMAPPAPHGSVTSASTWASVAEGSAAITEALTLLGLTTEEVNAFHRAWDPTLFAGAPDASLGLDLSATTTLPTLEESIFYFLPPELTERIATIDLDPPPTEIRRAMGVWTAI